MITRRKDIPVVPGYKWVAPSNTTLGVLIATMDASIVIISLQAHGVPADAAEHAASLPPVSTLFATFLGNNPIEHLLGSGRVLDHVTASRRAALTGHSCFPRLVSGPFHHGLTIVFGVAAGMALVSAPASALRGAHRSENERPATASGGQEPAQPRHNTPS